MSNSQWSNEQPPAWEGQNAPISNQEPSAPNNGWQPQKTSTLLSLTWGLFSKNVKTFLLTNFAIVGLGAVFTLLILRLTPVELSPISQALLNGDTKPLDDALAAVSTVKAQTDLLIETVTPLLEMFVRTIPFLVVTSLLASAFATKIALLNSDETAKVEINWMKFTSSSIAAFAFVIAGLVPLVAIAIIVPGLILFALLVIIPYFIWVGLGLSLLYPIVLSENIGGMKAVKRSLTLARNNRSVIFIVSFVVGILASLPGAAANQFMLLIPSSILNYVEVTSLANYASMLISLPITTSALVILYRYLHGKFHN